MGEELFGTFNPSFLDQSSKEIILGKTNHGEVTLIDNWYRTKKLTTLVRSKLIIRVYCRNYGSNSLRQVKYYKDSV